MSSLTTVRFITGLAAFSVVSGVIFAAWSHVVAPLSFLVGGHIGIGLIYGMWYIGGTLPAYILRIRGAAFIGETVAAIVELLLVSPYSILLYYYGPAQGIMSELAFALGRYKRWGWDSMALAGALPVIASYPFDCLVSPFYPACRDPGYPLELHLTIIASMLVSGVVLGGLLVKYVVDRVVEAGGLRGWPVAKFKEIQS